MTDFTRMKLGMIHDHRPSLIPDLAVFATKSLPEPARTVEIPTVADWRMAGNDQLGDCVIAEVVHDDMAWSAITGEAYTYPGDETVKDTYFGLTGGADTGLMIDDALAAWQRDGLGCSPNKITAFAPVHPHNVKALRQCVDFFGACRLGVNLPAIAQQQYANGETWDLTGTDEDYNIEGGHDVGLYAYDNDEPHTFYVVTWGKVQAVTLRWLFRYTTQARAVIPHEFVEKGGDARGVNITALNQWITHLNAQVA